MAGQFAHIVAYYMRPDTRDLYRMRGYIHSCWFGTSPESTPWWAE